MNIGMISSKQSIGQRLRAVRLKLGISQRDFAHALHTAPNHICQIEHGRCVPGGKLLRSMRRQFGIDINWLLSGQSNADSTSLLKRDIDALVENYQRADAIGRAVLIATTTFLAKAWESRKGLAAAEE